MNLFLLFLPLLHSFTNIFVGGRGLVKVLAWLAYLVFLVVVYCLRRNKKQKNYFEIIFVSVSIVLFLFLVFSIYFLKNALYTAKDEAAKEFIADYRDNKISESLDPFVLEKGELVSRDDATARRQKILSAWHKALAADTTLLPGERAFWSQPQRQSPKVAEDGK